MPPPGEMIKNPSSPLSGLWMNPSCRWGNQYGRQITSGDCCVDECCAINLSKLVHHYQAIVSGKNLIDTLSTFTDLHPVETFYLTKTMTENERIEVFPVNRAENGSFKVSLTEGGEPLTGSDLLDVLSGISGLSVISEGIGGLFPVNKAENGSFQVSSVEGGVPLTGSALLDALSGIPDLSVISGTDYVVHNYVITCTRVKL